MYVLDPLIILAEDTSVHSMAVSLLNESKKKEDEKNKKKSDPDLSEKVRDSLKGNKYKDKQTGKDISFATAYSRGDDQAKRDFSDAMSKAKSQEDSSGGPSSGGKKDNKKSIAKTISQLDPQKVNQDAVKILKALRGQDKEKAKQALEEIENGSERGTIDAIIALLATPEFQQLLGSPQAPSDSGIGKPTQNSPSGNDRLPSLSQPKPKQPKQPSTPTTAPSTPTTSTKQQPAKSSTKQQPSKPATPTPPSPTPTTPTPPPTTPTPPPTTPTPPVAQPEAKKEEVEVKVSPALDMERVKKWVSDKKIPFDADNFKKHLNTFYADMDDSELDAFMESYTGTVKVKNKYSDYKKYRDIDLNTLKDKPVELAKAMAIKKQAEFYFNPLNGLALDSLGSVKNLEKNKDEIRELQKNRYSQMTPEDRKVMGDQLQSEILKLDKNDPMSKKKIEVLKSAYEGLLASAMFKNDPEEMAGIFGLDPTSNMTDTEKAQYQENIKKTQSKNNKELEELRKLAAPLSKEEIKKKEENRKNIESGTEKLTDLNEQISALKEKIKSEGKSTKEEEKKLEALNQEKTKVSTDLEKIKKENAVLELRDSEDNEILFLTFEENDLKNLNELKNKIIKDRQNPKADPEKLKEDLKKYNDYMLARDKATQARSLMVEHQKKLKRLKKLEEIVLKDGSRLNEVSNQVSVLQKKIDKNIPLTEEEQKKYDSLKKEFKKILSAKEEMKRKEEERKILSDEPQRYPVNKDIVALVQTINTPETLKALVGMTKAKDQGSYKQNLKTVFKSVSDADLMGVVQKTSVKEMAKLLSPDYCPEDTANAKSKGYDDEESDSKCKVTLSYEQKQQVRDHLIDFISNEMFFTNADKGKTIKAEPPTESEDQPSKEDKPKGEDQKKQEDKTKEDQKKQQEKAKEDQKKQQEYMKKYTEDFKNALKIPDPKKREEKIREITTDLNLNKASQVVRDEKSKAMVEAIKKIPDVKKRQEYLELLQKNDSDPPLFEKTKLGTDKNFNKLFIKEHNNSKGLDFNMKKKSTTITNYQEIANTFRIGMKVFPFYGGSKDHHGTVVAIYPAIGMVDVQFPFGSARYPVEDLQIADLDIEPVKYDSIPGGLGTKPVNAKTALYWADKDRKYRMTRNELNPTCPRCKGIELKRTIYKRVGGKSERLLCCPECLFLIKTTDILGFN